MEGDLIYVKDTQDGVCCENIKKFDDGSFLIIGWDITNKGWIYKLSADEVYQWHIDFEYSSSYVTAANQLTNGNILLLLSQPTSIFHIITLDSNANLINAKQKTTIISMAFDGVVRKDGAIAAINSNHAFVMVKCHPGTYSSSNEDYCIPCPIMTYQDLAGQDSCKDCLEGEYQDKEGQSSCEPCTSHCESCTTGTNCLECSAGFYLETEDSGKVNCVTECRIGYSADMETKTCLGKPFCEF